MKRPVAITGVGILCPLGIGREAVVERLAGAPYEAGVPDLFDASIYSIQRAAQVPGFDPKALVETPKTYLDRCSALTLAACYLAVRDAGLAWQDVPEERRSLSHGTAFGCVESMAAMTSRVQKRGLKAASPVIFSHSFVNTPASLVAIEYSVHGPAPTFASGPLAGAEAVIYGVDVVAAGKADFCLAGAAEALSEPLYAALDDRGDLTSGPMIPAEGAAMLVLEPVEAARERCARILARVEKTALAGSRGEALAAVGGDEKKAFAPREEWGVAFAADFPVHAALAALTQTGPAFVALDTPAGGAALLMEVEGP